MKNKLKTVPRNLPFIVLTIIIVCCGFFLPGYLLDRKAKLEFDQAKLAPEEYYLTSNTIMARNSSEKLSAMEKVNLITGKWASTQYESSSSEAFLTETEAVNLAISRLEFFDRIGIYPYSLVSNYNNWYSWSTEVYRFTDSSFNTYTAYLWVITFKKFDNTLSHTIAMTEDGIILAAEVNEVPNAPRPISYAYSETYLSYITGTDSISCNSVTTAANSSYISSLYPGIDLSNVTFTNIYNINISENNTEIGDFNIYQYSTTDRYGFGIAPLN